MTPVKLKQGPFFKPGHGSCLLEHKVIRADSHRKREREISGEQMFHKFW